MAWKDLSEIQEMFAGYAGALSWHDTSPEGSAPVRFGRNIPLQTITTRSQEQGTRYKDPTQRHQILKGYWRSKSSRIDYVARRDMRKAKNPNFLEEEAAKNRIRLGQKERKFYETTEEKKQGARARARASYLRLGKESKSNPKRTPEGIERRRQQDRERKRAPHPKTNPT